MKPDRVEPSNQKFLVQERLLNSAGPKLSIQWCGERLFSLLLLHGRCPWIRISLKLLEIRSSIVCFPIFILSRRPEMSLLQESKFHAAMAANDLAEQISETTGSLPREWEAPDLDIQESPPTETDEISPAWPSSAKLRPLPVRLRISFSERRRRPLERRSSLETLHEDRPASFSRARPEDEMQVSAYSSQPRGPLKQNSSIQRHQNLEDVFTARDADAAVDQVRDESMILARLETNKIVSEVKQARELDRFKATDA